MKRGSRCCCPVDWEETSVAAPFVWPFVLTASGGEGLAPKVCRSGEGLPSLLGGVLKGETRLSGGSIGSGVNLLASGCCRGFGLDGIFGLSARFTAGGMEEVLGGN